MATIVFNYAPHKIEKLDELAKEEERTRSGYIQIVLMKYLQKKGIKINDLSNLSKPKTKKIKRKIKNGKN